MISTYKVFKEYQGYIIDYFQSIIGPIEPIAVLAHVSLLQSENDWPVTLI